MLNPSCGFIKRGLCLALAIMMIAITMITPALADVIVDSGIAGEVTETPAPTQKPGRGDYTDEELKYNLDDPKNQININGSVTTTDVNNWVNRKGNDVISIIQNGGRVIAIIGFFVSLVFIIIGAIGNRRTMTGGFIGALIAACCYVAITQGKELINLFSAWVLT